MALVTPENYREAQGLFFGGYPKRQAYNQLHIWKISNR
jgi:hypothetical protein